MGTLLKMQGFVDEVGWPFCDNSKLTIFAGNAAACAYTPEQNTQNYNMQAVKSVAKETPQNAVAQKSSMLANAVASKKSIRRRALIALARSLRESL